jgi:hypothetical protein
MSVVSAMAFGSGNILDALLMLLLSFIIVGLRIRVMVPQWTVWLKYCKKSHNKI